MSEAAFQLCCMWETTDSVNPCREEFVSFVRNLHYNSLCTAVHAERDFTELTERLCFPLADTGESGNQHYIW